MVNMVKSKKKLNNNTLRERKLSSIEAMKEENSGRHHYHMLGGIVGDVIGSTYERHNCKVEEKINIFANGSRCTDDSVLTLATANHFLTGASYTQCYHDMGNRYRGAGYGATFRNWLSSSSPQPYNSWGNGSAMRVSPIAWVANDLDWALTEAAASARVTHNHPEGIKGAQAVTAAIFLARNQKSKNDIKFYIQNKFAYDLNRFLGEIRPNYKFDVSCQGSVPEAIIAFLESDSFEDSIRKAISLGGDSDTIACITASISQAYYGSMPENIISKCRTKMDDMQLKILDCFCEKYNVLAHNSTVNAPTSAIKISSDQIINITKKSQRTENNHNNKGTDRNETKVLHQPVSLIDIGINITNEALYKHWMHVVERAECNGVDTILLTGTDIKSSKRSLQLATTWHNYNKKKNKNLLCTVGVHPHYGNLFDSVKNSRCIIKEMRHLLIDDQNKIFHDENDGQGGGYIVAIGECGLDYNRNFSSKENQLRAFRQQIELAYEFDLAYPLFIHEREAHGDLIEVLDQVHYEQQEKHRLKQKEEEQTNQEAKAISTNNKKSNNVSSAAATELSPLATESKTPRIVIHCFTGTYEEAKCYIDRGYYIGFTGIICKKERGKYLREEVIPKLPIEKIMIETDAPYMSFPISASMHTSSGSKEKRNKRRYSEPSDLVHIARKLSEIYKMDYHRVCNIVTNNTREFFKLH